MNTRAEKRQRTREALLQTAVRLFRTHGFHSVGIRDLAHRCHISVGTYYNYFSSKEEIVIGIVERLTQEIQEEYPAILDRTRGVGPAKALTEMMLMHIDHFEQYEFIMMEYASLFDDPRITSSDMSPGDHFSKVRLSTNTYKQNLWKRILDYLEAQGVKIPIEQESFMTDFFWSWYLTNIKFWLKDRSFNKQAAKDYIAFSTRLTVAGLQH